MKPNFAPGQAILVAARGFTPVLKFALEEAGDCGREIYACCISSNCRSYIAGAAHECRAADVAERPAGGGNHMYGVFDLAREVGVSALPVYAVSDNPAGTIVDIAATLGVDMLMLGSGASQRAGEIVARRRGDGSGAEFAG